MDRETLNRALAELPLYACVELSTGELDFSWRVRHICRTECPMYGKSWSCPPGVGTVEQCRERCLSYDRCLLIGTGEEAPSCGDLTARVGKLLEDMGARPYILSPRICGVCRSCTFPRPCRFPEKLHPCVESQGIDLIPTLERYGLPFGREGNVWYSLFLFKEP